MTKLSNPTKLARQAAYHRAHGNTATAERLETALNASGRCRICGRLLAREDSIAIGIGSQCLARLNNPKEQP
jgi:hypothetical protein